MRRDFSWLDKAACKGMDLGLFFPQNTGNGARREASTALLVCHGCPVRGECAEFGKRESGVWGGRLHAVKSARTDGHRELAPHGTAAAYKRHKRAGERPCIRCLQAGSK